MKLPAASARTFATALRSSVACGSSTDVTPDAGVSSEKACADEAGATCSLLQTCSGGALLTLRYGDLATCQQRVAAACMSSLSAAGTGATAASVEACAQALPSEACIDLSGCGNPVPACQPQVGTLADNALCLQCAMQRELLPHSERS